MKDLQFTEWFSPNVRPTIPGWYEREWGKEYLEKNADWWDGENWFIKTDHDDPFAALAKNDKRWRDLAEKP